MRVLRVYHGGRDPSHRRRDRALVAAGVDLTVVVPQRWSEGGAQDVLTDEPFPMVELPVVRTGDVNRHRYAEPAALTAVLADVQPDLVDLHEEPFAAVTRQWLRVLPRSVPVVGYSAQNIDKRWPPPFAQWELAALRRLTAIYPCSRQAASVLRGKGFTGLLEVLPLGVDGGLLTAGTQRHDDEVWTLLLVGRLVPEKGVRDAVEALARIRRHRPCRLVVAGRGPEGDLLAGVAQQLGVGEYVELRPWTDAAELAALYRTAHVVLVPSRATRTWVEQFGRVITEGQAAGAVVVGWSSGSIPEVGAGLVPLAPEGDVAGLAERVLELVRDGARWSDLRQRGLSRSVELDWPRVGFAQAAFYERASEASGLPRAPLRPDRAAAEREFGRPARVAGGGRPFALPVLREDTAASRTVARALDGVAPALRRLR